MKADERAPSWFLVLVAVLAAWTVWALHRTHKRLASYPGKSTDAYSWWCTNPIIRDDGWLRESGCRLGGKIWSKDSCSAMQYCMDKGGVDYAWWKAR